MATSYRPIKAAPSRAVVFRREYRERVVPKRTGMIKSACWECRKRKAKCNGQKPVCTNCVKMNTECVYDSDIQEARVRGLQRANEQLEKELEAATFLLKQVATGPDHIRSVVLEYLEDNKQPLEILRLLKDGDGYDPPVTKIENTEEPSGNTNGISPMHPYVADDTNFVKEESVLIQPEQSLHESNRYDGIEPATSDPNYMHPSMLSSPLYTLSPNSASNLPEYTAPWTDDIRCSVPELPELAGPQHQIPLPTDSVGHDFAPSIDSTHQGLNGFEESSHSLFFAPLFDRTDYLLTAAETNVDDQEGTNLQECQPLLPNGQPINFNSTPEPSLDGSLQTESINLTHTGEERLARSLPLRIHPNYGNNFGNLSLSSSVRANGFPRRIQDIQIQNIFVPNWAATTLNNKPHPGGLDDAFGDIYLKATKLLEKGEPLSRIIGPHPNIAALYDQAEFDKSCLLSQWAARMVHSVKLQGYDFTCFASMNIFWYLMSWMIDPSPETYAAIPEWIRPRPTQLFTPHISMADFVLWPELRELVVQLPEMQERMGWLADMSMFIRCDWPYELEQALHRNPATGLIDLVDLAKQHVWTLGCWSVGPTFRGYLLDADSYLRIRQEES